MSRSNRFDLAVIGTGSAASNVANRCRKAGWTVAVVDELPPGGTCALRGCDPKKILVGSAEAIDAARRLQGKGIRSGGVAIDWPELMTFKRSMIDGHPERKEESFRRAGIELFRGHARFAGRSTLVTETDRIEAKSIVIASGAKPAPLGIRGEEHLTTSTEFLELDVLPRRIVFVGGGFISFEFAHVAIRAGAEVTILHRGPHPLPLFDSDLAELLAEKSRALGIDVRVSTLVTGIEKAGGGFVVSASRGEEELRLEADLVVHGAGRAPAIGDLDLAAGGVETAGRRIVLNEFLQSVSNPAVYAAGDAAAMGPALTPVAGHEGSIVASNLLEGNQARPDYSVVPSVVFTVPPLASVGLTEEAARSAGIAFRGQLIDTSSWYSSRRVGETHSAAKVLVDGRTDRILGAHLLGPAAEETINLFAMAMRTGATASDVKSMLFAYPSHASDVAYMV